LDFNNEPIKLRFKILVESYRISKGYKNVFISFQHLYQILSCKDDNETNEVDKAIRFLTNEFLLESKALGYYSISHHGIKEVEDIISIQSSNYFEPYSIQGVIITKEVEDRVFEIRKKRITFLHKVYKNSNNDEMRVFNLSALGEELGYAKEDLERIYFYLEDEGLIQTRFLGGAFSITHQAIRLMEQPIATDIYDTTSEYSNLYPKLEESADEIVDLLHQINTLCKSKIGCNIFRADSKILRDLKLDLIKINRDLRDEGIFVLIILKIGTLIDDVYFDEIKKYTPETEKPGSINLMEQLFISYKVDTNTKDMFSNLRKLHCLRSMKSPVHQGESGAVAILNEFGIKYPIFDWIEVSKVTLSKFIDSLKLMILALQNIN
jgi:hypothetical protein